MSDDHTQFDQDAFQAMMAESMRWATLEVSLQEIADDNKGLVREMAGFSREETIPLVSALLTLPEYQSQCIRLEILVALAVAYCRGRKKTNVGDVVRWFSKIGASRCVAGEDPAEDVFVSAVHAEDGTYCMLEGTWEAAGFYTQQLLGLVQTMPGKGDFIRIKKGFLGLLRVSNLVCQRSGLHRYQLGSDKRRSKISPEKLPTKADLIDRVTLSLGDIESLQIDPQDIEPFVLEPDCYDDLPESAIGSSHLDRRPLVRDGEEGFVVALPTAITVAVRDLIIDFVFENNLVESFDRTLSQQYAKLFFDTPLLGGPTRAPVRWANVAHNKISNFGFEVDSGYYISFHLFQFSVAVHCDGGFKSVLEDSGELTSALQQSIDDAVAGLSKKSGFRQGLLIITGCGWGKGCVTGEICLDKPGWRMESISAPDLVRMSWLADMSPSYLWRIEDGYQAISEFGVQFLNPNGILNLIGWVRRNHGHFVPHAELPSGDISPERPLLLNPPLNHIRDVRVDSDKAYDRHRALDNKGEWHDVQHVLAEPFFPSESERRLYASFTEVQKRHLTTLYEGRHNVWVSVNAPNLPDQDAIFRLWETANEWLHRVGNFIDDQVFFRKVSPSNIKVYVVFLDSKMPEVINKKPSVTELRQLWTVTDHSETNACEIRFSKGFVLGFGVAENIAEREFVFALSTAVVSLLGVDDVEEYAERITRGVVVNETGRQFHLIHAQGFSDFV